MKKHNVPKLVGDVLREIGETPDTACWELPQNGTLVVLHKALERVAAHKNIKFDLPIIVESDVNSKNVAIVVTGHLGDKSEWSFGEAAPYNNKNSYPFAMAEKRAKDRVILKLVGLHGHVYSEEEADDFKKARPVSINDTPMVGSDLLEYNQAIREHADTIFAMKNAMFVGDLETASEEWNELTEEQQFTLWKAPSKGGIFTTDELKTIKSSEFRQAGLQGEAA